jgi:hypothetical protein
MDEDQLYIREGGKPPSARVRTNGEVAPVPAFSGGRDRAHSCYPIERR